MEFRVEDCGFIWGAGLRVYRVLRLRVDMGFSVEGLGFMRF